MSIFLAPKSGVTLTVAASDKLATYSKSPYVVQQVTSGSPNIPGARNNLFSGSGLNTSSAFSAATQVTIKAGDSGLWYATGTGPVIPEQGNSEGVQAAPGALNATGTLTGALVLGGIVTSSTAAAVTATLDTGTVMDQVLSNAAVNDAFTWSAINTGASNAFTVTASSGHTIVGAGAVALSSSGRFLSRKTATATWVTYRLS
jgi:hypothetical protein